jgi:phosphopantetheine adenylyltransferase
VREELGFRPLVIVVIGLIYSRYRAAKLSSTDLREDDAAAAGGGGSGGGGSRSGSPH